MTNELWEKIRRFIEPKKRREVARIIRKATPGFNYHQNNLLCADAGDWNPPPVKVSRTHQTDWTSLTEYAPCCECHNASSWKGWVPKVPIGRDIVFVCCEHMPLVDEPWLIEETD